jgi:hypothetical protein
MVNEQWPITQNQYLNSKAKDVFSVIPVQTGIQRLQKDMDSCLLEFTPCQSIRPDHGIRGRYDNQKQRVL